jgi:hypothetical protein
LNGALRRLLAVKRIIGISTCIEGVECVAVVSIKWQSQHNTFWQIRIGYELPTECDQISIALRDDGLGGIWFEPSGRYYFPSKESASDFDP